MIIFTSLLWSLRFVSFSPSIAGERTTTEKTKDCGFSFGETFYFSRQLSVISVSMPCLKYDCTLGGRSCVCVCVCVCNIQSFIELVHLISHHPTSKILVFFFFYSKTLQKRIVLMKLKVLVSSWTSHVNLHGSSHNKVKVLISASFNRNGGFFSPLFFKSKSEISQQSH